MGLMIEAGVDVSSYTRLPLSVGVGAEKFIREDVAPDRLLDERQAAMPMSGGAARTKVLVVDDEHIIANTLSIILNTSGFEARAVYSGEAAVQAFGSFQPDVVISDVVMTGMSGIETAIVFRTQRPSCKILLFSGQAVTADLLHDAREQGHHFEIMAKPVHPFDLLAKLRTDSVAVNISLDF